MSEYTTKFIDDTVIVSDKDGNSFNIKKTTESYLVDGEYFVTYDELLQILTEIKLSDALNNTNI